MRPSSGAVLPNPSSWSSSPSTSMPVSVMGMRTVWPAATCASVLCGVGAALFPAWLSCTVMMTMPDAALPVWSSTV